MKKSVNLPDGFLHLVGDHYIIQAASRGGYAALVDELANLGRPTIGFECSSIYIRIQDELSLNYWCDLFDRKGLWLHLSSLKETDVYGAQHDHHLDAGPLREAG
jgi:hypothetical protein